MLFLYKKQTLYGTYACGRPPSPGNPGKSRALVSGILELSPPEQKSIHLQVTGIT